MKLYVVRHGQTTANINNIIQGYGPGTLTELGVKQAKAVGKLMKGYKFDVIYCSDLKRCKDTLKEIHKFHKNVPVIYTEALRETNYGELEGTKKTSGKISWDFLKGNFLTKKAKNGESLLDLKKRVNKFLKNLRKDESGKTVLIVSHGGVKRMIHHITSKVSLKKSFKTFKFQNTSVCEYSLKGNKMHVECINDVSHLNE